MCKRLDSVCLLFPSCSHSDDVKDRSESAASLEMGYTARFLPLPHLLQDSTLLQMLKRVRATSCEQIHDEEEFIHHHCAVDWIYNQQLQCLMRLKYHRTTVYLQYVAVKPPTKTQLQTIFMYLFS